MAYITLNAIPTLVLSLGLLGIIGILLTLGRRLDSAMKLERFGIPIALLVGAIRFFYWSLRTFFIITREGAEYMDAITNSIAYFCFCDINAWKTNSKISGLWKPVASQALLGLLLGFGQYVVGGIIVLFLLPY